MREIDRPIDDEIAFSVPTDLVSFVLVFFCSFSLVFAFHARGVSLAEDYCAYRYL